jgi:putative transposase
MGKQEGQPLGIFSSKFQRVGKGYLRQAENEMWGMSASVIHPTFRGYHRKASAGRRCPLWRLCRRGVSFVESEMAISTAGKKHRLWRAFDQDGLVLDEIVQSRRNSKAAKRLMTRLLQKQGMPRKRSLTGKLRSCGAAKPQVKPHFKHRSHIGLNNRAENSHVPLRKRERMMQQFRSPGGLQLFVPIFSVIRNLFGPSRSYRFALQNLVHRLQAIAEWKAVTIKA